MAGPANRSSWVCRSRTSRLSRTAPGTVQLLESQNYLGLTTINTGSILCSATALAGRPVPGSARRIPAPSIFSER